MTVTAKKITNIFRNCEAAKMQYYSSFKYEAGIVYGEEEVVENFVTIAADPVSSLPDSFTLCSSLLVARAVNKH